MAERLMIEQFHVTFYTPLRLPEADHDAIRRVIDSRRFQNLLLRGVRAVVREYPDLSKVRVTLTW